MDVREYAKAFNQVERDYEEAVAAFGVPFEVSESCSRERRAQAVRAWARACRVPQDWDAQVPSIAIPLDRLGEARKACPKAVFTESVNVFEDREGQPYLRELGVHETEGGEGA